MGANGNALSTRYALRPAGANGYCVCNPVNDC